MNELLLLLFLQEKKSFSDIHFKCIYLVQVKKKMWACWICITFLHGQLQGLRSIDFFKIIIQFQLITLPSASKCKVKVHFKICHQDLVCIFLHSLLSPQDTGPSNRYSCVRMRDHIRWYVVRPINSTIKFWIIAFIRTVCSKKYLKHLNKLSAKKLKAKNVNITDVL